MAEAMINKRMKFRVCKTNSQVCTFCGKMMQVGEFGLLLNGVGGKIKLHKYIWIHLGCVDEFAKTLIKEKKRLLPNIVALGV